ncbi:GtrA family protein [Devosia sp.]|uniref:GtrA family protein n=1 Tax=Devosia sp. TaxID=1871048 RepID=UPI00273274C5|nr:GtrA family protein [Devosia sp.]MDP2781506.1 GtrA family protein [Devosia sp.]
MSVALTNLMRSVPMPETGPQRLNWGGLLRFIAIGSSGAIGFIALSSLTMALPTGLENSVINGLCYAVFILPIYLLHRRFSFQSDASHRSALPRYLAVQASALMLATLFGYVLYGVLAMPPVMASTLVIGLTSGVNYLLLRSWAFARHHIVAGVPA